MSNALEQLAIITVTYNPDLSELRRQMNALPLVSAWVIVDNASDERAREALGSLRSERANTHLIQNEENLGLATAINIGAKYVHDHLSGNKYLLLMDQDSIPLNQAIEKLLDAYLKFHEQDARIACVGPRLLDNLTGLQHGFHQMKRLQWIRVFPEENATKPISCSNLNGSGTLTTTDYFLNLGGLVDKLFIDHIDTEWAFRVLHNGGLLYGIPWATFDHRMGERGKRFWLLGWRVWPERSVGRHYYLFRNTIFLINQDYVPRVWKLWAVVKLLLTMVLYLLFDKRRIKQLLYMVRGLMAGFHWSEKNLSNSISAQFRKQTITQPTSNKL